MALILEFFSCFLLLIIVAASAHVATSRSLSEAAMTAKHEKWMSRHGRVYTSEEEKEVRFKIFKDNVKFIKNFNRARNQTYKLGINQFADLTNKEFLASYASGYKRRLFSSHPKSTTSFMYENVSVADVEPSKDWRALGAVTHVKNQLDCTCCWAFSAVAAIEGINKIKTGRLISLSEQEIVDCMGEPNGCSDGNYMENAFSFVSNRGLVSEKAYLYKDAQEACRTPRAPTAAKITTYENIPYGDEGALLQAVANQPVSVAINSEMIQYYQSGIVTGYCGTRLNHGLTVVGYGTSEDGIKYWLLKNSWGQLWGENGYLRLQRDSGTIEGMCGIAMDPSYPVM